MNYLANDFDIKILAGAAVCEYIGTEVMSWTMFQRMTIYLTLIASKQLMR